jgi:hypothetical protein
VYYKTLHSYHTDLFKTLLRSKMRDNPILASLLYVYCPLAAKWWINGAVPTVLYDPAWDAIETYATGCTLRDALNERGVGDLGGHIKKYIETVTAYRSTVNYRASELNPLFQGGELEVTARTGLQAEFDKYFGGSWRNVLDFARAWAFLLIDWRGDMGFDPGKYKFEQVFAIFSIPRSTHRSIEWPVWIWRAKEEERTIRISSGMMVNDDAQQDQLRFAFLSHSNSYVVYEQQKEKEDPVRIEKLWEVSPQVFALDRWIGWAKPYRAYFDVDRLVPLASRLALTAKKGACPPLGVLFDEKKCEHCGFRGVCFTKELEVTALLYETIEKDSRVLEQCVL